MKMDLSKFKFHSSDGKTTTLKHPRGHVIKIAHSSLSPEHKAAFDALANAAGQATQKMADGGQAQPTPKSSPTAGKGSDSTDLNPTAAKEFSKGASESGWQPQRWVDNIKSGLGYAQGGEVKKMADGGDPLPEPSSTPVDASSDAAPPVTTPEDPGVAYGIGHGINAAAKGIIESRDAADKAILAPVGNFVRGLTGDAPASAEDAADPTSPASPDTASAPSEPSPPVQPAPTDTDPTGIGEYRTAMDKAFDMQGKAAQQAAAGQIQAGKDISVAVQQNQRRIEDLMAQQKAISDNYDSEHGKFMAEVAGQKIDPNHYLGSMDTAHRVGNAIALMVGGLAGGLNKTGVNPAMEFINQQINRDMQAQQANMGKKMTLLQANDQFFHNKQASLASTASMMYGLVGQQIEAAKAKAMTPAAVAELTKAQAEVLGKKAELDRQAKMMEFMTHIGNTSNPDDGIRNQIQGLRMMGNEPMAKSMEERYVPGAGLASIPVPNDVRQKITSQQQLNDTANDLMKWSRTHTTLVPGTPDYNTGVEKSMILQQKIREGMLGTVFRESEKPLLEKFVNDNPAGFMKSFSTQPKLREIINSNMQQLNTLKRSYGLRTPAPIQSTKVQ